VISYLEGKLVHKTPTNLLIDVGGIGYFVNIPVSSYERIGEVGASIRVLTYLSVKENGIELFGFATEQERELFKLLIGVTGIGTRLAQAILSGLSVDDFRRSIIEEDIEMLTSISGIGKKTAQRLLFELKESFKPEVKGVPLSARRGIATEKREEAVLALVSLGYKRKVAKRVVEETIYEEEDLELEELIKRALRRI